MEKQPDKITSCNLSCLLMPNGEVMCLGDVLGRFRDLKSYLKPIDKEYWDELAGDEYLQFDRIPETEKLSHLHDVCGIMYLNKFPGNKTKHTLFGGAGHDIIYLDFKVDDLTDEDVIYLSRCGVHYDSECDSLAMFVQKGKELMYWNTKLSDPERYQKELKALKTTVLNLMDEFEQSERENN